METDTFIGVVPSEFKPNNNITDIGNGVGWDHSGWGSSKDLFNADNEIIGKQYAKSFKNNDIVKCEINLDNKRMIYYINEKSYGIAFDNLKGSVKPAISLYSVGSSVQLLNVN